MTKFLVSFLLLITFFSASSQEKLTGQPDLPGDILFDLGFNFWDQQNDTLKNWSSRSVGIYYNKRYRISKKFSFYAAAGLGLEKFSFSKNYFLNRGVKGAIVLDTLNSVILRNKMLVTYLDMPLELRFHPKGTIEGEGFFVSAGVIPGLKLNAHTRIKYEEAGAKQTQKLRANFGLNDYRLGLQFRVGWEGVNFFYKTYMTELFRKKQSIYLPGDLGNEIDSFNPTITTIGINFSGF